MARQISMSLDRQNAESSLPISEAEPGSPQAYSNFKKSPGKTRFIELSQQQTDMIREVFELFDTDGEGKLQEDELASALFAMGISTRNHHKMARDLVTQIDEDGDRNISLEEFTALMRGKLAGRDPEEEIRATFEAFCDYDPSVSSISLERLQAKSRKLQIRLTEEEMRHMIADADRNSGGDVDEEEYVHILKNSTWM